MQPKLSTANPFGELSPTGITRQAQFVRTIALFSPRLQALWALVTFITVAPELLPVFPMRYTLFCLYYAVKVVCFLSLGFLAPLVFRSLNGIGIGLLLSFASALVIETCQGLLHNGHTFHLYELGGKLALIALGFALALDCRYECRIPLGPVQIKLVRNDG